MNYYTVDVLTPDRVVAKEVPAESLLIPTITGQINVLPEHTHIVSQLDVGQMSVFGGADDPDRHFTLSGGVCKVLDKKIVILANIAEESHEIDIERSKRALEDARHHINNVSLSDEELGKYYEKLERAKLRLQLAQYAEKLN